MNKFVEAFENYKSALVFLTEAKTRRLKDEMRLRISDAEVECCEAGFRQAEQELFDVNEEILYTVPEQN